MLTIAVIDDDQELLAPTAALLEQAGYAVSAFADSKAGLKAVQDGQFDVLVTDMLMPDVDGIEVIRSLRKSHPKLWIVSVSGGGRRLPATTALRMSEAFGADRVLYKPFRKAELLEAIRQRDTPG